MVPVSSDSAAREGADQTAEMPIDAPDPSPPAEDADAQNPPETRHKRRQIRRLLPAPIWRIGRLLILALLIEYLVVPQLAGPRKVAHLLTDVNPLLLLAGLALEGGALLAYAQMTRRLLPPATRLPLFTILRIQMTTLSVSHCAPGGTATGSALGYRLLTQSGVAGRDVGFAIATQGIGSAVILNVILWLALIVSIPVWGFSAVYVLAAIVGVVLLASSAVLLVMFTRGGDRVGDALERAGSKLRFVDGAVLRRTFEEIAGRLHELMREKRVLAVTVGWASANWILDAGSLAVFVGAFGKWVNPDGLLVAYGLANVLAVIPITPGGLGVIEATLTSLLVGFDTPRGVATLGVVAYRLVNFWLPIPVGGVAYLSLQMERTHSGGEVRGRSRRFEQLRALWDMRKHTPDNLVLDGPAGGRPASLDPDNRDNTDSPD